MNLSRRHLLLSPLALPLLAQAAPAPTFRLRPPSLYYSASVIAARVPGGTAAIASWVHGLSAELRQVFAAAPRGPGLSGAAVVAAKPTGAVRVWLVLGSALDAGTQAALSQRLSAVPPVALRGGPMALALNFEVWGSGTPVISAQQPRPVPADWATALAGAAPADAALDQALARLWP